MGFVRERAQGSRATQERPDLVTESAQAGRVGNPTDGAQRLRLGGDAGDRGVGEGGHETRVGTTKATSIHLLAQVCHGAIDQRADPTRGAGRHDPARGGSSHAPDRAGRDDAPPGGTRRARPHRSSPADRPTRHAPRRRSRRAAGPRPIRAPRRRGRPSRRTSRAPSACGHRRAGRSRRATRRRRPSCRRGRSSSRGSVPGSTRPRSHHAVSGWSGRSSANSTFTRPPPTRPDHLVGTLLYQLVDESARTVNRDRRVALREEDRHHRQYRIRRYRAGRAAAA